LEFRDISRV